MKQNENSGGNYIYQKPFKNRRGCLFSQVAEKGKVGKGKQSVSSLNKAFKGKKQQILAGKAAKMKAQKAE